MRTVDHIVIGQGICGTFLSYYLIKAGKNVLVIDEYNASSATRVASGVINPVTGRSVVTTWMAEKLLPFAQQAYSEIGELIGEKVLTDANIAAFSTTEQMQNAFEKRLHEQNGYIQLLNQKELYSDLFHCAFESYSIEPSYVLDLHKLLDGWRNFLSEKNMLAAEAFDEKELTIINETVQYKDVTANNIIYCNGTSSFQSSYWQPLPFAFNKGQALIIQTDLPRHHVYKFGAMSLVPWNNNTWWVGSSYENNFSTEEPTEGFKQQTLYQLKSILKKEFTVVDHIASVRPAVIVERRPFVGFHPKYPCVGILNGMGTKGCSLAPYFAHELTENICNSASLDPLADVQRFKRILSDRKTHI